MASSVQTLKFFISYSHLDMKYKEKITDNAKSLELAYSIDVWHDGKILAGGDINREVLKEKGNKEKITCVQI